MSNILKNKAIKATIDKINNIRNKFSKPPKSGRTGSEVGHASSRVKYEKTRTARQEGKA